MFNCGEKVTFNLAGHGFTGVVYGYIADFDNITIDLETGERVTLAAKLVSRVGKGYKIGQVFDFISWRGEIVHITEKTVKVKVIESYGRKPAREVFNTLKRENLLYAKIIQEAV
jgi:hypothetical protein